MSGRNVRHVLQLVSRDEPGGVKVLTDTIAAGLAARGIEVETLALIRNGSIAHRLLHVGRVAMRVLTGRHDALFSYHAAAGILMATIGRLASAKIRLNHLTAMPDAIHRRWRQMDRLAGMAGGYTGIVANSQATALAFADYPDSYRRCMTIIPHAVIALPPPTGEVNWRDKLVIPADARILVAAGRLTDQKRYDTIVRALAALPQTHAVIAGDGPLRGDLLALAAELGVSDRLHLPGMLERSALADFLAIGEIYLSPSDWETFGLAAVEAQMAALPVIASDLPVLREVLGAAALPGTLSFHPVGDWRTLASVVTQMMTHYPGRSVLEAVATASRRHYGLSEMTEHYIQLCAAHEN